MEVRVHPNSEGEDEEFSDEDIETEDFIIFEEEDEKAIKAKHKLPFLNHRIQSEKPKELDIFRKIPEPDLTCPRLNFQVDNMEVVTYSADLSKYVKLDLSFKNILGFEKSEKFDETLTYNIKSKDRFKQLVVNNDAYLENDANYFNIPNEYLSKGTSSTILINSRVIVYWRGVSISDMQAKRIITLGFTYLIGQLTKAELYFYIREIIPKGRYEIRIKELTNSFVIIGIEDPIFHF